MKAGREKPWCDRDWLEQRYVDRHMTLAQITQEILDMGLEVTQMTVYNQLKKFNMIRNPRKLGSRSVKDVPGKKRGYYG
jgi:arginine repressor